MASCGNTSGALWIARHSHCPGQKWHDLVAHLRHLDEHGHLDFVNVGANKGYNLVSFMQRYSSTGTVNSAHWHRLIQRNGTDSPACQVQCCGVCNDCRARPVTGPRDARGVQARPS